MSRALPATVESALAAFQTGGAVTNAEFRRSDLYHEMESRRADVKHAIETNAPAIRRWVTQILRRRMARAGVDYASVDVDVCAIMDHRDRTSRARVEVTINGRGATRIVASWSSRDPRSLPDWLDDVGGAAAMLLDAADYRASIADVLDEVGVRR